MDYELIEEISEHGASFAQLDEFKTWAKQANSLEKAQAKKVAQRGYNRFLRNHTRINAQTAPLLAFL